MTYKIGDRVKIAAPPEAESLAREGWQGIIIDVGSSAGTYNVQFADKTTDWYFETWLKKTEEEVLPMPKQNIDWSKIKELTEMVITNKKDITITINADGSKEIEISTPTTSIVETQTRTRYVPEGIGSKK